MVMSLSAFLLGEKNKLNSTTGWIVGIECPLPSISKTIRIVDDVEQFTFQGNIYYPAGLMIEESDAKSDGSLEGVTLAVANVSRDLTQLLEDESLDGCDILIRQFHRSSSVDVIDQSYEIVNSIMGWKDVQFLLGHTNLFKRPIPKNDFSKTTCRLIYKGIACGYALALLSCDKTLDGLNGCRAHGDDEVLNGFPRLHPNNFGAYPTIPDDR